MWQISHPVDFLLNFLDNNFDCRLDLRCCRGMSSETVGVARGGGIGNKKKPEIIGFRQGGYTD